MPGYMMIEVDGDLANAIETVRKARESDDELVRVGRRTGDRRRGDLARSLLSPHVRERYPVPPVRPRRSNVRAFPPDKYSHADMQDSDNNQELFERGGTWPVSRAGHGWTIAWPGWPTAPTTRRAGMSARPRRKTSRNGHRRPPPLRINRKANSHARHLQP